MTGLSRRKHRFVNWSLALLIVLAILRFIVPAPSVANLSVFAFIVYFAVVQCPLFILSMLGQEKFRYLLPRPLLYILLFLMYVATSFLWTADKLAGFKHLILLATSGAMAILINWSSTDRSDVRIYLTILRLITLFGLSIAVWELSTGAHLPVSVRFGGMPEYVSTAWYPNENDFSFFLSLISPVFLTGFLCSKSSSSRILDLLLFFSVLSVIVLNASRAAMLAEIVVTVIIFNIFYFRDYYKTRIPHAIRYNLFTVGVFFAAGGIVLLFALVPNPFTPVLGSKSEWIRWQLQYGSIILLLNTIVGVGPGNFPIRFEDLPLPPDRAISAHNWLATLFGEYGIVGTVLFLLLLGGLLDDLLNDYLVNKNPLSLALFGSLLAFPLSGIGPNNVLSMPILWIVFGLSAVLVYTDKPT